VLFLLGRFPVIQHHTDKWCVFSDFAEHHKWITKKHRSSNDIPTEI